MYEYNTNIAFSQRCSNKINKLFVWRQLFITNLILNFVNRKGHNGVWRTAMGESMSVKILGAGAVGTLIGGLLAHKGHRVTFSGSEEGAHTGRERVLRIQLPDRYLRLNLESRESEQIVFLFVALKRHPLKTLSRDSLADQALSPDGKIVFLNCDMKDVKRLSPEKYQSLLCLSLLTAVMLQPGDIELTSSRSFLIFEKDRALREALSAFKTFGIEPFEVDDVEPYANSFFIWQLLFLPAAMCHTTYDNFLSYAEGREIASRVLEEGIETFLRSGKRLKKLPAMDPRELLKKIEKGGKQFAGARFWPDRAYNSLLQSIILDKITESRELNGRLVKMAAEAGVDPVWNWRLTQRLGRVLRVGFYRNPLELYKALD